MSKLNNDQIEILGTPCFVSANMAKNEYGLDTNYIGKNLKILQRDIDRYTPTEMRTALTRLGDACHNWAQCPTCSGYKTNSLQHDASRWFCRDCGKGYLLKDL